MRKLCPVLSIAAMAALVACSSESGTEVSSELPPGFSKPSPESSNEKAPSSSSVKPDVSVVMGTLTDERDGQTYRTVKIGDQEWMAENLNYKLEDSFCYEEEEANCAKYGQLYIWKTATEACPAGWHLPSKGEFETLIEFVGGEDVAGTKLATTSGWKDFNYSSLNGTDDYSFSALPGGYWRIEADGSDAEFLNGGYNASFWSSTEHGSDVAYGIFLTGDPLLIIDWDGDCGLSVRCLKD